MTNELPASADCTVVIPTYNGKTRGFVGAAIRSVLAQTLQPRRFLVVDDGSTDGTAAMLRAAFPDVEVLEKANGGLPSVRNLAKRLATTRYLAFLDDDDLWLPTKLAEQMAFLAANPDVGLLFCGIRFIDQDGKAFGERRPVDFGLTFPEILLGNQILPPSTVVFARALMDKAGPFDERLSQGEDYDYFIRCAMHGKIAATPHILVEYRKHAAQMSASLRNIDENAVEIIDRYASALPGQRAAVVRFYSQGAALRALLRGDLAFAYQSLRRGGPRLTAAALLDLGIRAIGLALAPFRGLKAKWRRFEYRRVLG